MMFPPRPTELAWTILRENIHEGDLVIDATAGNGHDTVFLAECAGATGRVLAFDIQEAAIRSATARVVAAGLANRVCFVASSHTRMSEHAPQGGVAAVMFNLGYLPGSDHLVTTAPTDTPPALTEAAGLLKSGGVLSVVCYPGHAAGQDEADAVETWMDARSREGWRIARYAMLGTLRPAPFLLVAAKP